DVLDDVGAAVGQDFVEHLGQEQRIDDVSLDLDVLDETRSGSSRRNHDMSPCRHERNSNRQGHSTNLPAAAPAAPTNCSNSERASASSLRSEGLLSAFNGCRQRLAVRGAGSLRAGLCIRGGSTGKSLVLAVVASENGAKRRSRISQFFRGLL